jgi:PST family polysaccharide transporter
MNLSGFITTSFTRFIISHYLGPAAVTYYVVSSRITNTIGGLLSNAFGVVFPVFSELAVAADKERLKASFYDASRLFASLSCPLYLLLAVCAAPTLTIWMGREFADKGAVVLAMLAAACLIGALTTVPNHFIIGTGHTRPRAVVSVVIIIYNVIAMPIATKTAGVLGLIVNQLVASILALIMLLVINERLSGFSIKEYLYSSYAFHIAPILITCCSVYYFISTPIEPYGMLGIAMIIGSVYFGLMTYSGWLPVKRLVGALRSKAGD